MSREFLDVNHPEIRGGQHALGGQEGQVREVFVIDGVVLVALDEPQQVRNLDAHIAAIGYKSAQSLAEVDDVRHVGEDVVGHHEICSAVLSCYRQTGFFAEK